MIENVWINISCSGLEIKIQGNTGNLAKDLWGLHRMISDGNSLNKVCYFAGEPVLQRLRVRDEPIGVPEPGNEED